MKICQQKERKALHSIISVFGHGLMASTCVFHSWLELVWPHFCWRLSFCFLPTHVLSYCLRVSSSCYGLSAKDWWQLEGEWRGIGFSQICRSLDSLVDKLVLLTASSVYLLMLTPEGLKVAEGKEESPLLVAASYIGLNWQRNHILRAWQRLKSLSYL